MRIESLRFLLLLAVAAASISCGGGGGGSNGGGGNGGGGGTTPPPAPALSITTPSVLPATLQGHAYSATLTAVNGQGALHWSIARMPSPTTQFVDGLTIDPNTGVISGTPTFILSGYFTATVTDSAPQVHTASANFSIIAYPALTSNPVQPVTIGEYQTLFNVQTGVFGGLPPVGFGVTSGTMPPGLRVGSDGTMTGVAYATGTYQFTLTAQDSFSPPETATQTLTITVIPPQLSIANSLPSRLRLNRPFTGRVVVLGGVPPYTLTVLNGSVPQGMTFDTSTGILSGAPTTGTIYGFTIRATDSSATPQSALLGFNITIDQALGRNDSPATATVISNGFYQGSISPYMDPPNAAPFAADNDYYKIASAGGATVHMETNAKRFNSSNPLDTVIEIVDGNGVRLNTCRQPGDTSTTFAGPCINDDISASPHVQDSAIDFQVPGTRDTSTTFYIHVFDWRGDARPDMTYNLFVSGVSDPLIINPIPFPPAAVGVAYADSFRGGGGMPPVSWSVISGSFPPGLTPTSTGSISGVPTTPGTFMFTVQASDSGTPPEVVTAQEQILVIQPVKITSPAGWTDACLNQPYSFTLQTFGGVQPLHYALFGNPGWPITNIDQPTGTYTGTPTQLGTFTANVQVSDATARFGDSQQVTLNVKQCP